MIMRLVSPQLGGTGRKPDQFNQWDLWRETLSVSPRPDKTSEGGFNKAIDHVRVLNFFIPVFCFHGWMLMIDLGYLSCQDMMRRFRWLMCLITFIFSLMNWLKRYHTHTFAVFCEHCHHWYVFDVLWPTLDTIKYLQSASFHRVQRAGVNYLFQKTSTRKILEKNKTKKLWAQKFSKS